jgi:hypothetical protein
MSVDELFCILVAFSMHCMNPFVYMVWKYSNEGWFRVDVSALMLESKQMNEDELIVFIDAR